jgi:hypothetical protein
MLAANRYLGQILRAGSEVHLRIKFGRIRVLIPDSGSKGGNKSLSYHATASTRTFRQNRRSGILGLSGRPVE